MTYKFVDYGNGRYANSVPARLLHEIEQAGSAGWTVSQLKAMATGCKLETARDTLARMVVAGKVFAAGTHKNRRWFAHEADAKEWDEHGRPRNQRERREAARLASEAEKEAKRLARAAQLAEPRVRHFWTEGQIAILKAEYPTQGARIAAEKTGQTIRAVRSKVSLLGLKCTQRPPYQRSEGTICSREEREAQRERKRAEKLAAQTPRPVHAAVTIHRRGTFDPSIPVAYHPDFKFTRAPTPPAALRTNTYSTY